MADQATAVYFDGASSRRRVVAARLGEALEISENGAPPTRWPYDGLRRLDSAPGQLRLACANAPELARLELSDADFIARLCALIPPARRNQTRYHGIFAPRARRRAKSNTELRSCPY